MIAALTILLVVLLVLQFLAWVARPVIKLVAVFCGLLLLFPVLLLQ